MGTLTIKQQQNSFVCTSLTELRCQGTTDSFQYPQKIPTQIKLPKKILAKFLESKNFKSKKFLQSSPSLEIPSTPPGCTTTWFKKKF